MLACEVNALYIDFAIASESPSVEMALYGIYSRYINLQFMGFIYLLQQ